MNQAPGRVLNKLSFWNALVSHRISQLLVKGANVKPIVFAHLITGPNVAGCRLLHNDDRHLLVINGRLASLTPTEYLLSLTLLRQRERWEAAVGQTPFCVSFGVLQRISGIQQRKLLAKHLSNASLKLLPLGIQLVGIGGSYAALLEVDIRERDGRQPYSIP